MIDKNLFLHGLTIRKGDLYVKEILTQPVVVGWDLIPVTRRGRQESIQEICNVVMPVSVIRRFRQVFRGNSGRLRRYAPIQLHVTKNFTLPQQNEAGSALVLRFISSVTYFSKRSVAKCRALINKWNVTVIMKCCT